MPEPRPLATVFTIGHSTHTLGDLIALLCEAGIDLLADVRSIPRSRTNPQFNADTLPDPLAAAGIGYRHLRALGGLRRSRQGAGSPNTLWRNAAFRSYADYTASDEFRAGLDELQALARLQCCAIMCAEAVWWRCHRRIIADYLLANGYAVTHIMGAGKLEPARPTPGMRRMADATLIYPAADEAGGNRA